MQTVLNDPDVLAKAAAFLRDASQTAETQAALLQLTVHVLNHPDTLKEVVKLTQELAKILAKDPDTIQQVRVRRPAVSMWLCAGMKEFNWSLTEGCCARAPA